MDLSFSYELKVKSSDYLIPERISTTISILAAWFKKEHRVLSSNLPVLVSFLYNPYFYEIYGLLKANGFNDSVNMPLHMIGSP